MNVNPLSAVCARVKCPLLISPAHDKNKALCSLGWRLVSYIFWHIPQFQERMNTMCNDKIVQAAVVGAAGKMGSRIAQLIEESNKINLIAAVEHSDHPKIGKDISEVIGGTAAGVLLTDQVGKIIDKVGVMIDFTSAAASLNHLREAASKKKAMVIGSTGFSEQQLAETKRLAEKIPCVLAPNMSIGVNVLFKVAADLARLLGDNFDVEIIEAHHRLKKDAPSGTAVKLAQIIASSLERDLEQVGVYARHGLIGKRPDKEIGIQTIRGGDIIGEHTVLFAGLGERIELTHKAHTRDNFARGAILATLWVVQQPPGLYDMQNVLGIK